ncbi:hypothetical protein [Thalassobius sp. I31.1]|uniref:hypothetical protein n=1 Tax=Thalassobius sp. I31.1 TaxID=2109912 RepID=UPI000D1A2CE1|nr:hypothetical protein [Thalassobius sp. I31.1]
MTSDAVHLVYWKGEKVIDEGRANKTDLGKSNTVCHAHTNGKEARELSVCDLVWNEYQLLYAVYEDFNGHFLTLKGWSVTIALAAIIAVYTEKLGAAGKTVLWIAALSALPFWSLDAMWKAYQFSYINRLLELEAITDCMTRTEHAYGIVSSWGEAFRGISLSEWVRIVRLSAFPHVFVLLIGITLAVRFPPQVPIEKISEQGR